jgi:hypothetical protein
MGPQTGDGLQTGLPAIAQVAAKTDEKPCASGAQARPGFRVSSFEFRVSSLRFQVSGCGYRVSSSGFQLSAAKAFARLVAAPNIGMIVGFRK